MPPGGDAKIDVTVQTAGRSGKLLKTVSVFSNDPKKPIAQLNVAIDIEVPDGGLLPLRTPTQLPPTAAPASRPYRVPMTAPGLRRAPAAAPNKSAK